MSFTRRRFLGTTAAAAALGMVARARLVSARGLLTEPTLNRIIERALAAAKKAGASWADVRIVRRRNENVSTREDHITGVGFTESYGIGVRVIASGAWGFAAASRVEVAEAERIAKLAVDIAKANAKAIERPVTLAPEPPHVDVWQTPLTKDPFKIPLADKADLLLAINAEAMKVKGIKFCTSSFEALGEWKLYANSDGASIEQEIVRLGPGYTVTATDSTTGEFVTRSHEIPPMQAGWEYVESSTMLADARETAEDAIAKLKAPSVTPGKRDLILAPSHLWLTIHESVGHPTELDRALGYEANFAGTSFITPDQTGKLRFGAAGVNLYADKTTPGGLATVGYDDDGVKTQKWDIVKDGTFVGWQTTRDQAGWIGEKTSRGTSYAQDYRSFPFQRMPNLSLAPGAKNLGVADLIAATDDGIYITGNGSYSIDHQRYNFQFGGQMFYEIKKGKITRVLKDVAYQSRTTDFWRSCDLIGGAKEWQLGGSLHDGKGEPGQSNAVSHGCPPTRFRGVNVLNTNERKRSGGAGGGRP
jgi:TldD protein